MNSKKSVILIAPRFTAATKLSRKIGLAFYDYFEQNNINVLPLGHFRVRRINFLGRLKRLQQIDKPPHLVVYIGHGEFRQQYNSLIGGEILGSKAEIFTLLNTRQFLLNRLIINNLVKDPTIFLTIGCSTGELGKHLVNKGLTSFIGTFQPTWVSDVDIDQDNVPDIIPLYLTLIQYLITGKPIAAGIEAMKVAAKVYYNRAEQLPESPEKQDILNTFASPLYYELIGQNISWV